MKTAHEHSDTGEVVFPTVLARVAVAFAAVTILLPAALAVLR